MEQTKQNSEWIQTWSGKKFLLREIDPEQICIKDIAHSLSMICRYNGHCTKFYSVAQHSILVSKLVKPKNALWGLMHDATESYFSDIPKPLKSVIAGIDEYEEKVLVAIAKKFKLKLPIPKEVKTIDMRILLNEKKDLMNPEPESWNLKGKPLDIGVIEPWTPERAEEMFLKTFRLLTAD